MKLQGATLREFRDWMDSIQVVVIGHDRCALASANRLGEPLTPWFKTVAELFTHCISFREEIENAAERS
jgi:hypothetical protein